MCLAVSLCACSETMACVLQVSDREYLDMSSDTPELLKLAEALISQGKGEDILYRAAAIENTPVCARRFQSLAAKGGDDDMFSSDLTDSQLQVRHVRCFLVPKSVLAGVCRQRI